jgi:outer membrane protein TolC
MRIKNLLLLLAAALGACVLPPKEAPHPGLMGSDRVGQSGLTVEPVADGWWSSFEDPQLDRLIRQGLKDSPTLAQAQARVGEALAATQAAQSKLLPSANLDASALYERAPENCLLRDTRSG